MGIEKIVNISISRQTAGVTQAGFGIPLILGPNPEFDSDEVRSYTSITAVGDDFDTTTPEYKKAAKIFSQNPKLEKIKIGNDSLATQVLTLTPIVDNNTEYTVDFGTEESPEEYTYMSDGSALNTEIVEGLIQTIMGEETQVINPASAPDGGNLTIHFDTDSVTVAWNDNAGQLQTKIRTLTGLEAAVVTGTLATAVTILMRGYSGNAPLLALSSNTLVASAVAIPVDVSVTQEGEARTHGVTASGTTTLILTGTAGQPFEVILDGLTSVESEAASTIADAILAAQQVDPAWYFLLTASTDEDVVEEATETIEAMTKIYMFLSDDEDAETSATDDFLSTLKASSLFRTACYYTRQPTSHGDAGFVGRVAPLDPGSETWANKTIASVPVDDLNDTAQTNLDFKNANYSITIAGVNMTQNGKVVGGEYIDVIRFVDWLQARMAETIFGDIARLDKIPFTDAGIAIIEADMKAVLKRGVKVGGITSYVVTVPKAADISAEDKAARRLTGLTFSAPLAGAVHSLAIQGTVTL